MPTTYLILDIILIVIGAVIYGALIWAALVTTRLIAEAKHIQCQVQPLVPQAKRLAGTVKSISEGLQAPMQEIKTEVNEVRAVVGRRTRNTVRLLQSTILSPMVLAIAASAGFRRAVVVWTVARRLRRLIPRDEAKRAHPARVPMPAPIPMPESVPVEEEMRKAA